MNCRPFKESISLKLGAMDLDAGEAEHIESCADCRAYYESLLSLESSLNEYRPAPLSEAEFASVKNKLDEKTNRYFNRATGFYRLAVHYGAAVTSVFLLIFISLFSNLSTVDDENGMPQFYYSSYTGEIELFDDNWIDDQYIDEAVNDFIQVNGVGSSYLVVGELSAEELIYLENNIDLGGLL